MIMSCTGIFVLRNVPYLPPVFLSWIQIRIPNADPDPAADKISSKSQNNSYNLRVIWLILTFFFLTSLNYKKAYFKSLYKYLYKYLFYLVKARILIRDPDHDPNPDPHLVFR
jgi:hypothetical protein